MLNCENLGNKNWYDLFLALSLKKDQKKKDKETKKTKRFTTKKRQKDEYAKRIQDKIAKNTMQCFPHSHFLKIKFNKCDFLAKYNLQRYHFCTANILLGRLPLGTATQYWKEEWLVATVDNITHCNALYNALLKDNVH